MMMRCHRWSLLSSRASNAHLWRLRGTKAFPTSCTSRTRTLSSAPRFPQEVSSSPNVLVRPVLFTGAVCLGSFGAVAIWNAELEESSSTQDTNTNLQRPNNDTFLDKIKDMMRPKHAPRRSQLSNKFEFRVPVELAQYLPYQVVYWIEDLCNNEAVGPIIVTSVALHALLRIPVLGSLIQYRFFLHDPTSGRALPMLLSTFAHSGIFHLGINMFVLNMFGRELKDVLSHDGQLLAQNEQLWAAYISAGTLASLGNVFLSQIMQVVRRAPIYPGLGASGAVCAFVSSVCLLHPDMMVSIVPFPYIPASDALKLMITFDGLGLLIGGTGLGHGAHLAGYATGAWVMQFGGLHMIGAYQAWVDQMYKMFKKKYGAGMWQ